MSRSEEGLTQDTVFDVLSSARRRQVLSLLKNDGGMELTELAERIAAGENDTTVEELTKQQRKRVYVSLYQTHIPKLEEAELVEYDQESGVVALRAQAAEVDRHLGEDEPVRWQYLYVAVAAAGLALVGLSRADVWVFAPVSEGQVAVVMAVAIAVVAAVHLLGWLRGSR